MLLFHHALNWFTLCMFLFQQHRLNLFLIIINNTCNYFSRTQIILRFLQSYINYTWNNPCFCFVLLFFFMLTFQLLLFFSHFREKTDTKNSQAAASEGVDPDPVKSSCKRLGWWKEQKNQKTWDLAKIFWYPRGLIYCIRGFIIHQCVVMWFYMLFLFLI